jgi:hypothetical protein
VIVTVDRLPLGQTANAGAVVSVRGSVVDVRFDKQFSPVYSVVHAGEKGRIVIEVLSQSDAHHVRGIALTPTQGLARGMAVADTGGPLMAPVGKGILSRMFDVFGNTLDRQSALSNVQWRSVHQAPPPLARRSTKSEIFETGIKAIDMPPRASGNTRNRCARWATTIEPSSLGWGRASGKASQDSLSWNRKDQLRRTPLPKLWVFRAGRRES